MAANAAEAKKATTRKVSRQPVRLYTKATFLGFQRNLRQQHPRSALLKIQGVNTRKETLFYLGKRVAFIYKAQRVQSGSTSNFRVVWGRVRRPHGNSGVVRATFNRNLNPHYIGAQVRVMLYPSRI
jgi:large subunit ribosomal protein L35Ae